MRRYFTDRYKHRKRNKMSEIILNHVWNGIYQLVKVLIANNNLAINFPQTSPVYITIGIQTNIITGTDEQQFRERLFASIPDTKRLIDSNIEYEEVNEDRMTISYAILDFIEFVYNRIDDVEKHLVTEDASLSEAGITNNVQKIFELIKISTLNAKEQFRNDINEIFYRNDLAYELNENGEINYVLEYQIDLSATSDEPDLKKLLETANKKIRSKVFEERKIALKELWDAYERIKTLKLTDEQIENTKEPKNLKKGAIENLLTSIVGDKSDPYYEMLNNECILLTNIGNNFGIRHSETYQKQLNSKQVNYLFFRLYSMVVLLLNK